MKIQREQRTSEEVPLPQEEQTVPSPFPTVHIHPWERGKPPLTELKVCSRTAHTFSLVLLRP